MAIANLLGVSLIDSFHGGKAEVKTGFDGWKTFSLHRSDGAGDLDRGCSGAISMIRHLESKIDACANVCMGMIAVVIVKNEEN